jgi:hypothetical protein
MKTNKQTGATNVVQAFVKHKDLPITFMMS